MLVHLLHLVKYFYVDYCQQLVVSLLLHLLKSHLQLYLRYFLTVLVNLFIYLKGIVSFR